MILAIVGVVVSPPSGETAHDVMLMLKIIVVMSRHVYAQNKKR